MSTSNVAQDLVSKVKAVAAFEGRVGLGVGATQTDPAMQKVPTPAAWIILVNDENVTTLPQIMCAPRITQRFMVQIIMSYTNEADFLTKHYPLLDAVRDAVHSSDFEGEKWRYQAQTLTELTGRLIYEQTYTLTASA